MKLTGSLARVDELVINGMTNRVAENHVSEFAAQSGDMILKIAVLILTENFDELYLIYSGGFDIYTRSGKTPEQMLADIRAGKCEPDEKRANTYNVVFAVTVRVAANLIDRCAALV